MISKTIPVLITGIFLLAGCTLPVSAQAKKNPPTVLIEDARVQLNLVDKKYVAYVEAIDTVAIQPRVSGNIQGIHFQEGEVVKKGQLLFEIEDTQYKALVQNAQARIAQINSKIEYATLSHERYEKLVKSASIAQDTVDSSKTTIMTLNAEKMAAEAELAIAEDNLSYTKITSPIKGRVGRLTYSPGNYITPQSGSLLTVTDLDELYIRFALSERDMMTLFGTLKVMREKAIIRLTLANGAAYPLEGKVHLTDNKVRSGTGDMDVWVKFANPDIQLVPGGLVTVHLSRKDPENLPSVLLSAIIYEMGKSYIYVLNEQDEAEKREVALANIVGNRQLLRSGVKEGERVVIDGTHKIEPGEKVIPLYSVN